MAAYLAGLAQLLHDIALLHQAGYLGLAPGPVPLLDLSQFDLTPEPADLESFAAVEASSALAELEGFDELMLLPGELTADVDWGALDEYLNSADAWQQEISKTLPGDDLDATSAAADVSDGEIVAAYAAIPGEAWQPVPDATAPPSGTAIDWPTDAGGGGETGGEGKTPTE